MLTTKAKAEQMLTSQGKNAEEQHTQTLDMGMSGWFVLTCKLHNICPTDNAT